MSTKTGVLMVLGWSYSLPGFQSFPNVQKRRTDWHSHIHSCSSESVVSTGACWWERLHGDLTAGGSGSRARQEKGQASKDAALSHGFRLCLI